MVIADIGGYTRYLAGVELEHSQDILADIMGLIVERLSQTLVFEQLEGDAVLSYLPAEASFDILETLEDCYLSFADRVRSIYRLSTCDCRACRSVPMLDLKFVVHYGTFLEQVIAGRHSLLGPDVILVHRLLKNHVFEETGLAGYAFLTDDSTRHAGIDAAAALIPHFEEYPDVGSVPGWIKNLERVWRDRASSRRLFVSVEEALVAVAGDIAAPAEMLFDLVAIPANQVGWLLGLDSVEEHSPSDVRGVGTVSHCIHGDTAIRHEVLDWQPPRYLTERLVGPRIGSWIVTAEVTDAGGFSRVSWRMRTEALPEGIDEQMMAGAVRPVMEQSLNNLAARVAGEPVKPGEPA